MQLAHGKETKGNNYHYYQSSFYAITLTRQAELFSCLPNLEHFGVAIVLKLRTYPATDVHQFQRATAFELLPA